LSKDSLKYLDSAAFYYAKCIEYSELINSYSLLATATNNLGGVYLYKNELDSALLYFNRAKDLSLFTGNMQIYAQALMSTGDLYNRQKKYKEALTTLDEAKLIAQLSDAQELVRDIAFMQSQAYYSLGDYKKAFSLLVEYQNVADRLKNEENTKKITKLNLRYEFEQKQKELEFQKKQSDLKAQAELKQQKLIRNVFVLAFGFVVLLAIVLYKNFKRKKRDNQILQIQKHEIEKQRDEIQKKNGFITIQNEKLVEQRDEIQSQKQSIIDSINYASRIQKAVLPPENGLVTFFDDSFIYYKPRDIVSGDFFWYRHTHNRFILVAADCTGHGVPAGFMSMLGVSLLNQIIGQNPNLHANEILNQLRAMVISSLHQEGTLVETKDGMDLSLLIFDKELKNMEFAAANNPLFLIRNKEILIYKADKMPIGVSFRREYDFALHNIDLQKGDKCYIFSDGYVDQFGGDRNGKFLVKRFRELLVEINYLDMSAQRERLHAEFLNWKGENEQVDDILIIGVSV
jgi:serine phosphatase RsbU (regulator of sigma subunit)